MMKCTVLFLVLGASCACAVVQDINDQVDTWYVKLNEKIREAGKTATFIPPIVINENVSTSDSFFLALDSFKRTGDCTLDLSEDKTTIALDVYFGFGLWSQSFRNMRIHGEDATVHFRVKDNSFHISYTIHNETKCYVTLEEYKLETFTNVEFSSSRQEYDGLDLNSFFEKDVLSAINQGLDKQKKRVEHSLQFICRYVSKEDINEHLSTFVDLVHQNFNFQ